jgi:hypothetical protein
MGATGTESKVFDGSAPNPGRETPEQVRPPSRLTLKIAFGSETCFA